MTIEWKPRSWAGCLTEKGQRFVIHMVVKEESVVGFNTSMMMRSGSCNWSARSMYGSATGSASNIERAKELALEAADLLRKQFLSIEDRK